MHSSALPRLMVVNALQRTITTTDLFVYLHIYPFPIYVQLYLVTTAELGTVCKYSRTIPRESSLSLGETTREDEQLPFESNDI